MEAGSIYRWIDERDGLQGHEGRTHFAWRPDQRFSLSPPNAVNTRPKANKIARHEQRGYRAPQFA
jgi:hypothetical protein